MTTMKPFKICKCKSSTCGPVPHVHVEGFVLSLKNLQVIVDTMKRLAFELAP